MPAQSSFERRWKRVTDAEKHLQDQALAAAKLAIQAARVAARRGDAGPAQWILSHVQIRNPETGELVRPIVGNLDKQGGQDASTAPRIVIGIGLGADIAKLTGGSSARSVTVAALPPGNPQESGD